MKEIEEEARFLEYEAKNERVGGENAINSHYHFYKY